MFLERTPAPYLESEDKLTDIALGVHIQEADKALESCNADKEEISKLVQAR